LTASVAGAGAINVIYGDNTTATPGLSAAGSQLWHQNSPDIEGVTEAGDRFVARFTDGSLTPSG
jgi:hypothetical protein